jgi:tRNA-Thr(GGU) m(6)t(6)A37 methyltransferase TsaA
MNKDTDLRANEQAIAAPLAEDATLQFIGQIRTPWPDRYDCPRQGKTDGPECQLVLDPLWQEALLGIEEYTHLEVLYWLNLSRRDLIRQSPREDGRAFGTFALRSPVRPNPIGTSVVKLERVKGNVLTVRGLDCVDGTPLIDIKPERSLFTPKARPKPTDPI